MTPERQRELEDKAAMLRSQASAAQLVAECEADPELKAYIIKTSRRR